MRARLSAPDAEPKRKTFGCSGMERFEANFVGELPPRPSGYTLDITAIHIEPEAALLQAARTGGTTNPLGTAHGG